MFLPDTTNSLAWLRRAALTSPPGERIDALRQLLGPLDTFTPDFNLIEPNPIPE